MHCRELTFKSAAVDGKACTFNEDKSASTVTFRCGLLGVGEHEVTVEFSGVLNDLMAGFYRSTRAGGVAKPRSASSSERHP